MPLLAGQVIRASDMVAPIYAIKTGNQTTVSNSTLLNDTQLFVDLLAGRVYQIQLVLITAGDPAGDVKVEWSTTGTIALRAGGITRTMIGPATGATSTTSAGLVLMSTSTLTGGTYGLTSAAGVSLENFLVTCTVAGRLQLRWAQASATAVTLYVMTGSYIIATPLS